MCYSACKKQTVLDLCPHKVKYGGSKNKIWTSQWTRSERRIFVLAWKNHSHPLIQKDIIQRSTEILYTTCRLKVGSFFSKHSLFNVEIWYDLDILTLLLPSDRMEISSGGCPNATLEEAPSSICESQTRSSTWWRRKWCQKAVDAAALSRTKCRAKGEEGLVEVSGTLPAT